ncbi:MAG: DUF4956 domain-containing protein [Ardenticatenales bacterium]|nr:DUF4956 domain-containing protein [Ardenticatenales bacterium]
MTTPTNLLIGFAINLLVAVAIVRFIYYPVKQNKNFVFTFIAFNIAVYFVMSVLTGFELSVGVGFGLFGLFSLLRYRTDTMPAREMTYLFIIIALPVMNSILVADGAWLSLAIANAAIMGALFVLEQEWGFHYELSQRLTYERIELIRPENYDLLLTDLRQRTGLPITRAELGKIDFLKDSAEIRVYYPDQNRGGSPFSWLDGEWNQHRQADPVDMY